MSSSESRAVRNRTGVRFPGRAQAPADLEAVQVRHQHIQHDGVEPRLPEPLQRRESVGHGRDTVPLQFERGLNRLPNVRIVVHDEHAPSTNFSGLHQRPFIPGLHASVTVANSWTKRKRARTYCHGQTTIQVEQGYLSEPHPKLRTCLRIREDPRTFDDQGRAGRAVTRPAARGACGELRRRRSDRRARSAARSPPRGFGRGAGGG